ncbi:MAG: hypothetical protein R3324_11055 [Halobacteriales archaeon]|nr:hypothetical protein [Halobacteriales archaeon]
MAEEIFTDPEDPSDDWVDVRMTDPEEGEWDIDMVVIDGQVQYVDLRIRPELLTAFVDCLIGDVGEERAEVILTAIAERNGIDFPADGESE